MKLFKGILILGLFLTCFFFSIAEAFTYSTSTKTARMQAVEDNIDAGAGAGTIELATAGYSTVCVIVTLDDPAGSVIGTTLSFTGFPKTVAAIDTCNPASVARIKDSDGNVVINNLTVGTSGTNIIVDNTSINSGQSVTFQAAPSFTHG